MMGKDIWLAEDSPIIPGKEEPYCRVNETTASPAVSEGHQGELQMQDRCQHTQCCPIATYCCSSLLPQHLLPEADSSFSLTVASALQIPLLGLSVQEKRQGRKTHKNRNAFLFLFKNIREHSRRKEGPLTQRQHNPKLGKAEQEGKQRQNSQHHHPPSFHSLQRGSEIKQQ